MLESGSAVCWGEDHKGRASPPDSMFIAISAGIEDHSCGVLEGGKAVCWGYNLYGQSAPPDEKFISISVGVHHSCGMLESGRVICWGTSAPSTQEPTPRTPFRA